ncbi:hypothetical protein ACFQ1I_33385 [Kitasatospora arboriphila]
MDSTVSARTASSRAGSCTVFSTGVIAPCTANSQTSAAAVSSRTVATATGRCSQDSAAATVLTDGGRSRTLWARSASSRSVTGTGAAAALPAGGASRPSGRSLWSRRWAMCSGPSSRPERAPTSSAISRWVRVPSRASATR